MDTAVSHRLPSHHMSPCIRPKSPSENRSFLCCSSLDCGHFCYVATGTNNIFYKVQIEQVGPRTYAISKTLHFVSFEGDPNDKP